MTLRLGVISCSYELDTRLIIRRLGPGWNEAALENGATELAFPGPLGQPLLMFLSDATTVQLYELIFARVLAQRRQVTFPIRCDAPDVRRYLSLTVRSTTGGFVVSTILLRAEARPHIRLLARDIPRRSHSLPVCSWCKRANVEGHWLEIEDAVSALGLFQSREQPQLSHTICAACHQFMATMLADDSKLPPL